ncbi:YHS domain-containing protein [Sedimenticola selenatireducens]|uniref:YHS domain-containing protein n=1 Tax=Sedimenticola selenatireducens TaxID=191960 RepID=UPI0004ADC822|nr:YHS domain-containing protein [Sedimenticola selenatireducens]
MIFSLNGHERMPLEKVFKERMVEKTEAIAMERPIEELGHQGTSEQHDRQYSVAQAYHAVEQLPTNSSVLLAEQVMTAPVVTSTPEMRISDALQNVMTFFSLPPQETAMKHQDSERTFKDPVCGMEVSRLSAVEAYDYQGKTYYFCSGHCREVFEAEPEKHLRHHRQHGVKRK